MKTPHGATADEINFLKRSLRKRKDARVVTEVLPAGDPDVAWTNMVAYEAAGYIYLLSVRVLAKKVEE